MSRRSFPHIDPAALRDVADPADEARIERVWERVERDLVSRTDRAGGVLPRRSTLAYLAMAATLSAFGAGVLLGKVTWDKRSADRGAGALVATAIDEKSVVEVLAAGTQLRAFPLQGGGSLTLLPGSTVEVERTGSAVTLSLLQGEASIESKGRALAVVAGEARINTQAGSVISVTRNADDLDVNVTDGTVSVTSPAGALQLGKNQREAIPLHAAISSAPTDTKPRRNPVLLPLRPRASQRPVAAKAGEWFAHYPADDTGALVALRKQGVAQAIETARGANELMAIAELMSGKGGDQGEEIRALERLVRAFPSDQRASLAADRLGRIYDAHGDAKRAKNYKDKVQILAQSATTGSDSLICDLIRREPDKTKAALSAKEYLAKYPDGECREEFERLVQRDAPSPAPEPAPAPPVP